MILQFYTQCVNYCHNLCKFATWWDHGMKSLYHHKPQEWASKCMSVILFQQTLTFRYGIICSRCPLINWLELIFMGNVISFVKHSHGSFWNQSQSVRKFPCRCGLVLTITYKLHPRTPLKQRKGFGVIIYPCPNPTAYVIWICLFTRSDRHCFVVRQTRARVNADFWCLLNYKSRVSYRPKKYGWSPTREYSCQIMTIHCWHQVDPVSRCKYESPVAPFTNMV